MTKHTQWQAGKITDKLIIGLTGGIGSGKTLASDWFIEQGIFVVDADVIAHEVVGKGSPILMQIQQKFGDWVLNEQQQLDRQAMRDYVFKNANALRTLESIVHPAIREQAKQQLANAQSDYVILSAPLLLEANEAGLVSLCQRVLVIDAPEALQLDRASSRDGQSVEKIKAVMQNQLPRSQRLARADDVALNDGSKAHLYQQLQLLHHQYLQMAKDKADGLNSQK